MSPVELESRIQDLFEDSLAEDQWPELRNELVESEEAREIYHAYAQIHTLLNQKAQGAHVLSLKTPVIPIDEMLKSQRKRTFRYAALSAAAILVIGLLLMQMFFIEPKPVGLVMEMSPGTKFSLSHDGDQDQSGEMRMVKGSRLKISQGAVELNFASGVKSIVMAPADMTLHDDSTLYMNEGSAWFNVPAKAVGFQVKTRDLDIVDLGTEFGVRANPDQHDEVHVITGKIKVAALRLRKEVMTLTAGEARRIDPIGRLTAISAETSAFVTSLPKTLPHIHWSFDDIRDAVSSNTISAAKGMKNSIHGATDKSLTKYNCFGRFDNALSLDGKNSYLETDWPGIMGNAPRTVAFWIKIPQQNLSKADQISKSGGGIIAWGRQQSSDLANMNSKWTVHMEYRDQPFPLLHVSFGGFWYFVPDVQVDDNLWHHITVTYDGNSDDRGFPVTRVFIDGKPQDLGYATEAKLHRNDDGEVIIDTEDQTPLIIGSNLDFTGQRMVNPKQSIKAQIDELYIIQGVIGHEAIRKLMKTNQLPK